MASFTFYALRNNLLRFRQAKILHIEWFCVKRTNIKTAFIVVSSPKQWIRQKSKEWKIMCSCFKRPTRTFEKETILSILQPAFENRKWSYHFKLAFKQAFKGLFKWSACLPTTPTIRVQIPLTPADFYVKFVFENNSNKPKRGGAWHIF